MGLLQQNGTHIFYKRYTMAIPSYLKKSPTRGSYSFRRRVPPDLQKQWGKLEEKCSLKTKNHAEALRRGAMYNTQFDERVELLRKLSRGAPVSSEQMAAEAREIMVKRGLHPQQLPLGDVEKGFQFLTEQAEWREAYWANVATEGLEGEGSPYTHANRILEGEPAKAIIPTLREATESYISVNAVEKKRTPDKQKKHEQRVWRAIDALGRSSCLITDWSRVRCRGHISGLKAAHPEWQDATLNKAITSISAVFHHAITEYELTNNNPWKGLRLTISDQDEKRRSFAPDELSRYVEGLDKLNVEARLVGLLMVHTGCRTMEAAGLMLKDLQLSHDVPHILIRPNSLRSLKNTQSKRKVPLIKNVLNELRDYLNHYEASSPTAPVFPRYGRIGGMDPVSQLLNGVIKKRLKIDDPKLVSYSTRHTMKDKMRMSRGSVTLQEAVLGHGKRTDASKYGEGELLAYMLEVLEEASLLMSWSDNNDQSGWLSQS